MARSTVPDPTAATARSASPSHVARCWGGWGTTIRDDPFPTFAELLEAGPVHPVTLADGHDAWLVLGHDAAKLALNDRRLSKDMQTALAENPAVVAEGLPGPAFSRHMMNLDPPDHSRLRKLVATEFSPERVAALAPRVQDIADALCDRLASCQPGATVDLVSSYAQPLPFDVIGQLLGVPPAERAELRNRFQVLLSPWAGDPPPEAVRASDAIVARLEDLVAEKAHRPADDLVSALVQRSVEGDRLDHQELLSTLFQLIVAGHDTTTTLIGNSVVALLEHPGQLQAVRADSSLLPGAVEELVRFTAPVPHATFRYTTEAVELCGVEIPAKQQVLVCLAAANRDPVHLDAPHELDVHRSGVAHVGFGHGIHFCLGARLARLETRIALTTLLARFPDLRLAVDRHELRWGHGDGLVLRGLTALPVILEDAVDLDVLEQN